VHVFVQIVSLMGAGLILGAFFALQRHWWTSRTPGYLWSNFIGAVLLTMVAVVDRRLGFVVLEVTWAAVSLWSILRPPRQPAVG
jgi:hypothetical protein